MIKINENFCGVLDIQNTKKGFDSSFSVNDNLITIIPLTKEARSKLNTLSYNIDSDGKPAQYNNFIYGRSNDNKAIALYQVSNMLPNLPPSAYYFRSPFMLYASSTENNNLAYYDSIEFYGGIMNLLHPVILAIDSDFRECIKYTDPAKYTKIFAAEFEGVKFKIIISIITPRAISINIPDLKNEIYSILRFDFETSQPLETIFKYYSLALRLFQFCAGRLNVRADIRLYQKGISAPILTKYKDGYSDYANDTLNFTQVINLLCLEKKFMDLFNLLSNKKASPYLEFLPYANKYAGSILYTNVNDICIAFEKEYKFLFESENAANIKAAKNLADDLLKYIEQNESIPDPVRQKANNIIGSNLKNFSPSTKEKIIAVYNKFSNIIKCITQPEGHDIYGITKFYSDDEFRKQIRDFVNIRNTASHAGVKWNDSKFIFMHLKLLIYYSVLDRAGFTQCESSCILSNLFGSYF